MKSSSAHVAAEVFRLARSEPALGSLKPWHQRTRPCIMGSRCFALFAPRADFEQHRPEHPDAQVDIGAGGSPGAAISCSTARLLGRSGRRRHSPRPVRREPAAFAHALEPQALVFAGELDGASRPRPSRRRDGLAHGRRAVFLQPLPRFGAKLFKSHIIAAFRRY